MRIYGRNRARMLGEELDVQEAVPYMHTCSACGKAKPPSEFGGGRYMTCDRCRGLGAAFRSRRREVAGRVQVD